MNVYHSHILSGFDTAEKIIRKERLNPEQTLGVIDAGRQLRKMMDELGDHNMENYQSCSGSGRSKYRNVLSSPG